MLDIGFKAYIYLLLTLGAVSLFGLTLWALGYAVVKLLQMLRVWHALTLCVGVLRHGENYRDEIFWRAIRERAEGSGFEAKNIASFAMKHARAERQEGQP